MVSINGYYGVAIIIMILNLEVYSCLENELNGFVSFWETSVYPICVHGHANNGESRLLFQGHNIISNDS